jgi:8-oxo-dGTP pyrophosphatase MutT (NUDIX family)
MTTGWVLHDVAPTVQVVIARAMPDLSTGLERDVEELWRSALRKRPRLFNGRLFSADEITPSVISGHWTEFRRALAQIDRPDLHEALRIRSLAVNGVISCKDGVLIGRRSSQAVYQAGQWQLPPAGSLDPGSESPDGTIDVRRTLLDELEEELGLPRDRIGTILPLCLVEHPDTHVTDFGMAMTTDADAETLLSAHKASGNLEYEAMHVLPVEQILQLGAGLMPTVPVFLGRLPAF